MRQITFKLDEDNLRPIVRLKAFHNIAVLIDTGADFPVWVAGKKVIESLGAEPLNRKTKFTGFGGEVTGELYRMDVTFGNSEADTIIYNKMPIILCEELNSTNYQLIMPATAFENMMYQVDNVNNKFNVDVPDNQISVNLGFRQTEDGTIIYTLQK
ncbi:MAG: hypothetical protein IJ608_01285 [Lachnospiraceae bacterium]|nr:hypothetical protein [Lachnospiraceae bacterium]